ncbi:MAG TPA: hypothetical protein PKI32_05865 [Opitutales bacterium]|nr:hypothetical protein [Opitutales bacterium]
MTRGLNDDLKIEVEPQNKRGTDRSFPDKVEGDRASLAAGYTTLSQADTDPYSSKERRGIARDANFARRY